MLINSEKLKKLLEERNTFAGKEIPIDFVLEKITELEEEHHVTQGVQDAEQGKLSERGSFAKYTEKDNVD